MARYSVFVGDGEVNDWLLTREEAEDIADAWKEKGYDDVFIYEYTDDEIVHAFID